MVMSQLNYCNALYMGLTLEDDLEIAICPECCSTNAERPPCDSYSAGGTLASNCFPSAVYYL